MVLLTTRSIYFKYHPNNFSLHPFSIQIVLDLDFDKEVVDPISPLSNPLSLQDSSELKQKIERLIKLNTVNGTTWRDWLDLRDSIKIGREQRYSDQQIIYHYTTDLSYLKELIKEKN